MRVTDAAALGDIERQAPTDGQNKNEEDEYEGMLDTNFKDFTILIQDTV